MPRRSAPPPDFRYVGLEPVPEAQAALRTAGRAGFVAFAIGLIVSGTVHGPSLVGAGMLGIVTAYVVARGFGPTARLAGVRMSIVPWGVLVHSDSMPRILRWSAVREVSVSFVHEMDSATPITRWSVVTIRTERELLGGRARGGVTLERLEAHLQSYANEAALWPALDLDGNDVVDAALEPSFERLLLAARRLLRSGALSERLSLPPASYRQVEPRAATPKAICELGRILESCPETGGDPRPLACVLAAELGATELLSAVAELSASPHPLLAAVARGSALCLGGDVKRVGGLDEVAEFVCSDDLEQIRAWIDAHSYLGSDVHSGFPRPARG